MSDLTVPTIHRNGTSREGLLEPLCGAVVAIHDAMEALARCAPHSRDYYVQAMGAYNEARDQHDMRMDKLRAVMMEINALAEAIDAGGHTAIKAFA